MESLSDSICAGLIHFQQHLVSGEGVDYVTLMVAMGSVGNRTSATDMTVLGAGLS